MLSLSAVAKSFFDPRRGEVRAVDGIDLELSAGVVALVGANGAGKSTLLRLIATLLVPDRGTVRVDGLDSVSQAAAVRTRLGYLSTTTRLYPRLTGRELLRYTGGFHPLSPAELSAAMDREVERFALHDILDQTIAGLSTGQLQRLNLARVLLPSPRVLILDEPTTGLDLVAARQVVEAVLAARADDRLIIFCTHLMPEVERVADRLVVLRQGRIAWDGAPATLGSGAALADAVLGLVEQ